MFEQCNVLNTASLQELRWPMIISTMKWCWAGLCLVAAWCGLLPVACRAQGVSLNSSIDVANADLARAQQEGSVKAADLEKMKRRKDNLHQQVMACCTPDQHMPSSIDCLNLSLHSSGQQLLLHIPAGPGGKLMSALACKAFHNQGLADITKLRRHFSDST